MNLNELLTSTGYTSLDDMADNIGISSHFINDEYITYFDWYYDSYFTHDCGGNYIVTNESIEMEERWDGEIVPERKYELSYIYSLADCYEEVIKGFIDTHGMNRSEAIDFILSLYDIDERVVGVRHMNIYEGGEDTILLSEYNGIYTTWMIRDDGDWGCERIELIDEVDMMADWIEYNVGSGPGPARYCCQFIMNTNWVGLDIKDKCYDYYKMTLTDDELDEEAA